MKTAQSEADLAEMIGAATGPLAVQGGGTRGIRSAGEIMCTEGLNGVDFYEPGALTLVVGAGTSMAEIDTLLASENQQLAFEPMDHRPLLGTQGTPTIGGVVAANISGPRRILAGACRDFLLGVRYVDGRGQVIKNGGRVMKNVTGYDLVKLMAGSWGTLGVLTQVSLKVLPRPETQTTVTITGPDLAEAVHVMSTALGSPFEVSGAAFDPQLRQVLIRVDGFVDSVAYRAGRLAELLAGFGAIAHIKSAGESAKRWAQIRDVECFATASGDVWRLSVKPSDAPEIANRLSADGLLLDWGGGLIWARVAAGTDVRARLGQIDGHATLIRATPQTRARLGMFHPQSPPLEAISAGLRAKFDPNGIFNQGLMGQT